MCIEWYVPTGNPRPNAPLSSSVLRSEFDLIEKAFDRFPTVAGKSGQLIVVNESETGYEAVSVLPEIVTGPTGLFVKKRVGGVTPVTSPAV